jgi:hypothetical protein
MPNQSLPERFHLPAAEGGDHKHGVLQCRLDDTLLPKLISGELRVKDAERFVGGVGSIDEVDSGRA